jgi:ATP-dependent Clp protease protease subunit
VSRLGDEFKKLMRLDAENNIWVTNFDTDSVIDFYEKFMDWEHNPLIEIIPVYLNSFGGQVHSLIAKRDLIKTSVKPVSTIAVGKAMSCGASLLASGTKGYRFASPDTRILIHQVSSMTIGKAADIKTDAAQVQDLNEMMLRNLAEDTGNSVQKLKREIKNRDNTDWTMTAKDAMKWGIIDGIGIPRYTWDPAVGTLQLFVDEKTGKRLKKGQLK